MQYVWFVIMHYPRYIDYCRSLVNSTLSYRHPCHGIESNEASHDCGMFQLLRKDFNSDNFISVESRFVYPKSN